MDVIKELLNGLNEEQTEAVKATEGYVRVVAGAGSGKTKVLTNRYVYIAKALGVSPEHILSVTFTNKAAKEMKKRIQHFMPDEDGGWILTFHGACHKILKYDIQHLNYPSNFMIMDEEDQKTLLKKIYDENGLTIKNRNFKTCLDAIAVYKSKNEYVPFMTDPENKQELGGLGKADKKTSIDFVIKEYLTLQRKNFYLDFDDLVFFVLYLLRTNDEICEKWQRHFEYIQVDEFQDVDKCEYELVRILSNANRNLFVVGDPDQTIYSWRGADIKLFVDFDKVFPNVKTVILDKNYRSTPEILQVSNSLISRNTGRIKKQLKAVKNAGEKTLYFHAQTKQEESLWIADKITELLQKGVSLSDIAVLYRSNYMSRAIEEAFVKKHIPYVIYSGIEFYKRREIKDILSYLRMLVFEDDLSFLRILNNPPRGIGKKREELIKQVAEANGISLYKAFVSLAEYPIFASTQAGELIALLDEAKAKAKQKNISDLLDFMLKQSGYEKMLMLNGDQDRLDNMNELKYAIEEYVNSAGEEVTLEEYLNDVSLISNSDAQDKSDSVKMMTVHTAKGLEFPYVFVCSLNEGLFPSQKIKSRDEMEEERRVAYVAFTRAEKKLFLSDSDGFDPQLKGRLMPSRFIFDIDENLFERTGIITPEYLEQARAFILAQENKVNLVPVPEDDSLKEGCDVVHPILGQGKIMQEKPDSYIVAFANGAERTILKSAGILKKI